MSVIPNPSRSLAVATLVLCTVPAARAAPPEEPLRRNRIGGVVIPGGAALDYERFLTENGWLAVGATVGTFWNAGDLKNDNGSYGVDLYAINPFVRFYLWRPTPWFRGGFDVKPSIVFIDMERDQKGFEVFPAVESHLVVSFQHRWAYAVLGAGAKLFLDSREIPVSSGTVQAPKSQILSSGELAVGVAF